jgi:4-hydroxy-tetrahydrodipicolinate synthase
LTVPAYNKPPQEGLYQHFKAIAESTSLPCVLYNVTSRTSLNMTDETTIRLSEIDNIVGVKEAGSDLNQITRIIDGAGDDFRVWSGNDDETFSIMATGGYGVVSVLSHLVGNQIKQMMGYLLEGDVEKAAAEHRRLLPLFKVMFIVSNPIPLKYSLNHVGFNVGPMRLPLVPPDDKSAEKILEVLADFEIDLAVPA